MCFLSAPIVFQILFFFGNKIHKLIYHTFWNTSWIVNMVDSLRNCKHKYIYRIMWRFKVVFMLVYSQDEPCTDHWHYGSSPLLRTKYSECVTWNLPPLRISFNLRRTIPRHEHGSSGIAVNSKRRREKKIQRWQFLPSSFIPRHMVHVKIPFFFH